MNEALDVIWMGYLKLLLSPFMDYSRFFIPYLLGTIIIAYSLYRKRTNGQERFLTWLLPRAIYKHPSAKNDLWIILLQPLILGMWALLLLPVAADGEAFMHDVVYGFLNGHFPDIRLEVNLMTMSLFSILWLLIYDFAQFLIHYLYHKISIFWEFHAIHHSAEVLNPMTAYRFHPLEIISTGIFVLAMVSCVTASFHWLFGEKLVPYQVMTAHIGIFIFYLIGYNLRHSHIWFSYPRWLENILISPAMHQIHHSADPKHWDKNMGFIFSVWDRIFGTIYYGGAVQKLQYGLDRNQDPAYQNLLQLYMRPFVNIYKMVSKK